MSRLQYIALPAGTDWLRDDNRQWLDKVGFTVLYKSTPEDAISMWNGSHLAPLAPYQLYLAQDYRLLWPIGEPK